MRGLSYMDLRTTAEMLEDVQKSRISNANRVESATVSAPLYAAVIGRLRDTEQELSKVLVGMYREVAPASVVSWQEATPGVGAHLLARLLGHLGDPREAQPKFWAESAEGKHGDAESPKRALQDGEPFERTVGQLWQYCGHGRALRPRKGMSQEEAFQLGNPRCKMLVHLIAEGVVKAQVRKQGDGSRTALGELGRFYLAEKARYAAKTHSGPCSGGHVSAGPGKVVFAKCKVPTGSPTTHGGRGTSRYAEAGDPYQPGHVNAIALRHLGKKLLQGLWVAAGEEGATPAAKPIAKSSRSSQGVAKAA